MKNSLESKSNSLPQADPEESLQESSAQLANLPSDEEPDFWTFTDPDTGEKTCLRPHMFKPGEQVFNDLGEVWWTAPLEDSLDHDEHFKVLSYAELRQSNPALPLIHEDIVTINLGDLDIGGMATNDSEV